MIIGFHQQDFDSQSFTAFLEKFSSLVSIKRILVDDYGGLGFYHFSQKALQSTGICAHRRIEAENIVPALLCDPVRRGGIDQEGNAVLLGHIRGHISDCTGEPTTEHDDLVLINELLHHRTSHFGFAVVIPINKVQLTAVNSPSAVYLLQGQVERLFLH